MTGICSSHGRNRVERKVDMRLQISIPSSGDPINIRDNRSSADMEIWSMGFVYESATEGALDHERGITVNLSRSFTDTFPELPYIYSGNGMRFDFFAMSKDEPRQWLFNGVMSERKLAVVGYILENSLPWNLPSGAAKDPERDAKYASIKEDIREGMFTLWSELLPV
jgi:hypothetical protein